MKSLLLSVVFGLSLAGTAYAQSGNTYDDDIYSSGPSTRKQRTTSSDRESSRADNYDRPGDDRISDNGQYAYSGDNYIDYDDDDYYYSSSLNRFGYSSFYTRPYFSVFSNPYWYNPYWVDPYWGWSPWNRTGFSVGVSFGGPYWNSYWGWQNWYGYTPFNSFYYPSYYGGWGYYNWGCGGYYGNYWNGYYAGIYNGYGSGWNTRGNRTVTYGPRFSMNNIANNQVGRSYPNISSPGGMSPGRMAPAGNFGGVRNAPGNMGERSRDMDMRSRRGGFFNSGDGLREYNGNTGRPAPSGNVYRDRSAYEDATARPAPGGSMDRGGFRGRDMNSGDYPRMDRGDLRSRDMNAAPVDRGEFRSRDMNSAPMDRNEFRGREMNDFPRSQPMDRPMQAMPADRGSRMEMQAPPPSFNNAPSRGFGGSGGGGGVRMGGGGGGGGRMGGFGGRR